MQGTEADGCGLVNRMKRLSCRLGLHLWCTPPGPFWIHAYQRHVLDERPHTEDEPTRASPRRVSDPPFVERDR